VNTKRSPTKIPKKTKTSGGSAKNEADGTEDKKQEFLPSPEWVGEMVVQILGANLHPDQRKKQTDTFLSRTGWDQRQADRVSAEDEAIQTYSTAMRRLERRGRVSPPPPEGVTPKERVSGHVTFERGCKLITGEERRDRAKEKYTIWREWEMGETDIWDGMPEIQHGFSLFHLAEANASYEKYFKKALADHKRRKKQNSRQKAKNSGQIPGGRRTKKS